MPKNMMTNIKIKGKSRRANYLTNKSFFDKIKDRDELKLLCLNFLLISYKTDHANLLCNM